MPAVKPGGTREQQTLGEWLDNAALVRARLSETAERVPEILPYWDGVADMIACFGLCELHARAVDRAVALKVYPERQKWLKAQLARQNKAGIEALRRTRKTLKPLHGALIKLDLPSDQITARLDEGTNEVRLGVADWEMKGSDATAFMERVDGIADVVRKSGLPAITEHVDKALAELEKLRKRADRGAVENFPIWKLWTLVAILGVWVLGLVACGLFGCAPVTTAFWNLINAAHLFLLVLFC
jgi:hypothetical protein